MAEKLVKDSQCLAKDLVNDCISRREAIDIVNKYNKSHMRLWGKPMIGAAPIVTELEDLPSAQPKTHDKRTETHASDLISRAAVIDAVYAEMPGLTFDGVLKILHTLPPAQPERKRGKWEIYVISMFDGEGCRCSECGLEGVPYWDFCPNCGADMRGE